MNRLALFVATAGYVGYVPVAPGTFGSAVGLLLFFGVRATGSAAIEGAALVLTLAAGTWAADVAERLLGKDPSPVIIDEVLGMLVTVAFLDLTLAGAAAGFVLFRALDVIKPPPAARLEEVHGGPGIMLDDVMAGLYAHLLLRVLIVMFPGVFV